MYDTIAAIATAHGVGSIAIVRLSGPRALPLLAHLSHQRPIVPRHATLMNLYDPDEILLDEALVIYFQGPKSFTGEDVVELQCHGGSIVAHTLLRALIHHGARLAQPGEFSKRAFLNGRIDLTQAEAISALIEAGSEEAAHLLARQMRGELRHQIEQLRHQLIEILAYSEVMIDYAEEDLPTTLIEQLHTSLDLIQTRLSQSLQISQRRSGLLQGYRVAIIGKPNVGKSSLLNALLSYDRAIVSDIAGTTRDTIEEQVRLGTHLIRFIDTAGIRHTHDQIEQLGIQRSLEAIEQADMMVVLFDGSRPWDDEDAQLLQRLEHSDKPAIVLINKTDLPPAWSPTILEPYRPLSISVAHSIDVLIHALEALMEYHPNDEMMLTSTRQIHGVEQALKAIEEAILPLHEGELEFFSFHLNEAIRAIASITRPYEVDEMLDSMFGTFCLGK